MTKNVKKYEWVILFLFLVSATFYYYGLHLSFWPDPESSGMTLRYYWADKFGYKISSENIILSEILASMTYKFFGAGYLGIRLYHSFVYFIVISLTTLLAVCSLQNRRINWYVLTLFSFLAVILNPGSSELCGFHTSMYHVYPFDMHTESLVAALFGYFSMDLILHKCLSGKVKGIIIVLLIGLIVYKRSDLLFIIGFCIPMVCIGALRFWKKNEKSLINLILLVLLAVVILRAFSIFYEPLRGMFVSGDLNYGNWTSGGIYGNIGFVEYDNIWNNFSNTITELLAVFNVELSGQGILSINTLISSVRIAVLVLVLMIAGYYIIVSFHDKNNIDYINTGISYGIVLNILMVIFSKYGGDVGCIRYMTMVLFLGTILLCRNADGIVAKCNLDVSYMKKSVFIGFLLCICIDIRPAWKDDDYQAEYEGIFTQITDTIMDNQLGNGVGGHWFSTNLTALMDGEYAVLEGNYWLSEGGIDLLGCHADVNYFVEINGDYRWYSDEDIYHFFGEPDRIYKTEDYQIYYYNDGIKVKE